MAEKIDFLVNQLASLNTKVEEQAARMAKAENNYAGASSVTHPVHPHQAGGSGGGDHEDRLNRQFHDGPDHRTIRNQDVRVQDFYNMRQGEDNFRRNRVDGDGIFIHRDRFDDERSPLRNRGGRMEDGGAPYNHHHGYYRDDYRRDPYDDVRRGGFDEERRPNHHIKLNFPQFDGEADPLTWLTKCDSYFRAMRTREEDKVWLASMHLNGIAAKWYYALARDHGNMPWFRFTEFVNLRFGPPIRTNGLAELKDLFCT